MRRRWKLLIAATIGLPLLGLAYQHYAAQRDAGLYPPPGKLVSVGDHRLHIWCIGEGSPTVLMIAGGGTPSVTLFDAQSRIARFTHVCSYDRTGLGWSDTATKPMGLAEHAADLETLLAKSGVQGPLLLAPESMGGLIALSYARRNMDRVAGAVFIDASETKLYFDVFPPTLPEFRRKDWLWQIGWRLGIIRLAIPYGKPDFVDRLPTNLQAQFYAVWSRPIAAFSQDSADVIEHTAVADRPFTVARSWGDRPIIAIRHGKVDASVMAAAEPGWPAAQDRLAALSTNGQVVVANTAHMIAQDAPQLVAEKVRDIVSAVRLGKPSAAETQDRNATTAPRP